MAAGTQSPDIRILPGARRRAGRPLEFFPVRWAGPSAMICLPSRIDDVTAGQVRDALLAVINRGIEVLVIDLSATVFLSRAGALAVARARRRAAAARVHIRIVAPESGQPLRSLEQATPEVSARTCQHSMLQDHRHAGPRTPQR